MTPIIQLIDDCVDVVKKVSSYFETPTPHPRQRVTQDVTRVSCYFCRHVLWLTLAQKNKNTTLDSTFVVSNILGSTRRGGLVFCSTPTTMQTTVQKNLYRLHSWFPVVSSLLVSKSVLCFEWHSTPISAACFLSATLLAVFATKRRLFGWVTIRWVLKLNTKDFSSVEVVIPAVCCVFHLR